MLWPKLEKRFRTSSWRPINLTAFFFLLACANSSMGFLEDEIDRLKDENKSQHEQILALQAQLQDTEEKMRKVGLLMLY